MERIISEEHSFRLWVLSFFDVNEIGYRFDGSSEFQETVTPEIEPLLDEILTKDQVFAIANLLWSPRSKKIINFQDKQ